MFVGKVLADLIIGPTTTQVCCKFRSRSLYEGFQEDEALKTTYRNAVHSKISYTIFLSNVSVIEDFLGWMPWILATLVVTTMLDLMDLRIANPQHNTSNRTTRGKYLLSSIGSLILACGVFSYLFWAGEAIEYEYKMLMIADVSSHFVLPYEH